MGMSKVNFFVSELDKPCDLLDTRTWYLTIFKCNGEVLKLAGVPMIVLPMANGHLELDLPPGTYYAKAVWGFTVVVPGEVYRANHFTDAAIFDVCCDHHTCVKIFAPTVHRCGFLYAEAVKDLAAAGAVPTALAQEIADRVAIVNQGQPLPMFEVAILEEIRQRLIPLPGP